MWIKTCVRLYFLLYFQTEISEKGRKYVDSCRFIVRYKREIRYGDELLESG